MPKVHKPITLEPELELLAATWSASRCRSSARVFARWARQLMVKAQILDPRVPRGKLPRWQRLTKRQSALN